MLSAFLILLFEIVGCVNSLKANVELFKNEIPVNIRESNYKTQQYLSVVVPEELKDYAFIQIQIVKSEITLKKKYLSNSKKI